VDLEVAIVNSKEVMVCGDFLSDADGAVCVKALLSVSCFREFAVGRVEMGLWLGKKHLVVMKKCILCGKQLWIFVGGV